MDTHEQKNGRWMHDNRLQPTKIVYLVTKIHGRIPYLNINHVQISLDDNIIQFPY